MIALASEEARNTWLQLEIVMSQWRAIERKLDEPGPFIYAASRTVLRPVDLKQRGEVLRLARFRDPMRARARPAGYRSPGAGGLGGRPGGQREDRHDAVWGVQPAAAEQDVPDQLLVEGGDQR